MQDVPNARARPGRSRTVGGIGHQNLRCYPAVVIVRQRPESGAPIQVVHQRADVLVAQADIDRQLVAELPVILNVITVPPGAPRFHTFAYHAGGGERLPQDKVGERLTCEVAAEVEAAAP